MYYKVLKTKLKTTKKQEQFLDQLIKERNDMWNYLVEVFNPKYKNHEYPTDTDMHRVLREKFPSSLATQILGARTAFKTAWSQTFAIKARREPRFHSWRKANSVTHTSNFNIVKNGYYHLTKEHKLKLAEKVPELKRKDLALVTFSRRAGKYYISLTWKEEGERPITKSESNQIGLDWGCENFLTDQNGEVYNLPVRVFRTAQRIKALQKVVSKKDREGQSKNWQRAQKKLSDAWCRYNNLRTDFIEKLTFTLLKQNELVALEDLDIQKMIKKSHKNRRKQIYQNSYNRLVNRLLTKKMRFTSEVILVDRFFPSSQIDPTTGERHKEMKDFRKKEFILADGSVMHRDQVAAINILNEANRMVGASMY